MSTTSTIQSRQPRSTLLSVSSSGLAKLAVVSTAQEMLRRLVELRADRWGRPELQEEIDYLRYTVKDIDRLLDLEPWVACNSRLLKELLRIRQED